VRKDRFCQHNLDFGQIRITPMVEMMLIEQREDLLAMVRNFKDFNEDNDHYGERD
jgi:hypothetical protein